MERFKVVKDWLKKVKERLRWGQGTRCRVQGNTNTFGI
jgi:hypothetical protein